MDVSMKNDSFIDEWMSSTSANKFISDIHLPSTTIQPKSSSTASKHMGVQNTKLLKSTNQFKGDNLYQRIEKQNLRKQNQQKKEINDKKNSNDNGDEDDIGVELHGVIEPEEEGKLSTVVNKQRKISKSNGNNSNKPNSDINDKIKKSEVMDKNNERKLPGKYKSVFESSSNNNSKSSSNTKKINSPSLPTNDIPIEKKQHKRKKVRSKQKNIRKDNRPDDAKPAYLRLDADQYLGRELTKETLDILQGNKLKKQKLSDDQLKIYDN